MTMTRPLTSITVITTFEVSDSRIPRAFTAPIKIRNTMAASTGGTSMKVVR